MGRTATRIFVIVLLLITIALAIWSALFLIRTARESDGTEPVPPDTTATVVVPRDAPSTFGLFNA
ncbi:MAG: hypothetical protein GVY18_01355 [Bacteroidetes bacterium]|jgi:uncharacterized SAM-binding protein YcdF (DUF218 family)|nr:hypothetical protein [Bacteroidota bacterium]